MFHPLQNREAARLLFGDWPEAIIWACLDGTMGRVYADDPSRPTSAMALLGDFAFLAGAPNQELAVVQPGESGPDFIIMVPQNKAWAEVIRACFGRRARQVTRYAFLKEPEAFDRTALEQAAASLSAGYELKNIDETLYHQCRTGDWSRDLVSQYPDYETYRRLGLGVAAVKDGVPCSGASSYASFRGGIEIEIDTRPDSRRQRLAYACGAKLILECLDRGLYPSWDAQNPQSAALAEKLGYHMDRPYTAFEVRNTPSI